MQLSHQDLTAPPAPSSLGYSSARIRSAIDTEAFMRDMAWQGQSVSPTDLPVRSGRVERQVRQAGLRRGEPEDVQTGLSGNQLISDRELPSDSERPANRHVFRYCVPPQAPKLNRRELALQWVARNSKDFAGQWVVLDGDRLLAHGTAAREVAQAARVHGVGTPAIIRIPEGEEIPFAGW